MLLVLCMLASAALAQPPKKKGGPLKSVKSSVPDGYTRVGQTDLYAGVWQNVDFYGLFGSSYYSSTYSDGGYHFCLQVNDSYAQQLYCGGDEYCNVALQTEVAQQGELVRVSYLLTNNDTADVVVNAGTYADVMIGNNDSAPISRRKDQQGNTYGLSMSDGGGAQLCLLFGSGLAGVSPVSDFWFGRYNQNSDAYNAVGNYSQGSNWMQENGSYDSGMGWCWKGKTIAAGQTLRLSYLLGLGDVRLEPKSDFAVTPDDSLLWNDITLPHRLTIKGLYESPAGLDGRIEWADETMDSTRWEELTAMMPSGTEFEGTLTANFDPSLPLHTIRFRAIDNVGNATVLVPITYTDIRFHELQGIADLTYTGQPQEQQGLHCDLPDGQWAIGGYRGNTDAGTATLTMSGVFPETIGLRDYTFNILPAPLPLLALDADSLTYNGRQQAPQTLAPEGIVQGRDFIAHNPEAVRPGLYSVEIEGTGNYTGAQQLPYTIVRAPFPYGAISGYYGGQADFTFDGQPHSHPFAGRVETAHYDIFPLHDGGSGEVGAMHIYYNGAEGAPANAGEYAVSYSFDRGEAYEGCPQSDSIGSVRIYEFDAADWQALTALTAELTANYGVANLPWDIAAGPAGVALAKPDALAIERGKITAIDLSGLLQAGGGQMPQSLAAFANMRSLDISSCGLGGDLPQALAMAAATGKLKALRTLKAGGNGFTGNIGIITQAMQLDSLLVAGNHFSKVLPLVPANVVADITGQTCTEPFDMDMATLYSIGIIDALTPADLMALAALPTVIVTTPDGHDFDRSAHLELSTHDNAWQWNSYCTFSAVNGQVLGQPTAWDNKNYTSQSGDTVRLTSLSNDCSALARFHFGSGDANFDGAVSAADLQATILEIFGQYPALFNQTAADTYTDGNINVQDVVCTTNILLAQDAGAQSAPAAARAAQETGTTAGTMAGATVWLAGERIMLRSDEPVAAICVRTEGSAQWRTGELGMTQTTSPAGMAAYSLQGRTLPAGADVEIGRLASGGRLLAVSLANTQAGEIAAAIGKATGAEPDAIAAPHEADADGGPAYNLAGQKAGKAAWRGITVRKGKKTIGK